MNKFIIFSAHLYVKTVGMTTGHGDQAVNMKLLKYKTSKERYPIHSLNQWDYTMIQRKIQCCAPAI